MNNIFLNHLPTIDLHGYDRETARVIVNDFVKENIKLREKQLVIIHGIGTGILRKTVHQTLLENKKVISYKIDMFNEGCTIVNLDISN